MFDFEIPNFHSEFNPNVLNLMNFLEYSRKIVRERDLIVFFKRSSSCNLLLINYIIFLGVLTFFFPSLFQYLNLTILLLTVFFKLKKRFSNYSYK